MSDAKDEKKINRADHIIPNINDVLCGRGSGVNSSSGNIYFRQLVRGRKSEYKQAKRHLKIPITKEIIKKIRSLDPPGRFLARDEDNEWREYSNEQAMIKTAQALREGATKAERNRIFLNGKDGDSSPPSNPIDSSFQIRQGLVPSAALYNRTHINLADLNNLNNPYTGHSNMAVFDDSPDRNSSENRYIHAYMQTHKDPTLLCENRTHQLHSPGTISEKLFPKVQIPSLHTVQSLAIPQDVSNERFDDADENIEMPIKILMESVQMGRRRKYLK